MADEKVLVELKVDSTGAIKAVRQFKSETDGMSKAAATASTGLGRMGSALKVVGGIAAGFAAYKLAGGLADIARSAISTGANFERLGVQMKSIMGSIEGGKAATEWVTQFTANTPYQLEQVTEAFVKLKAFGINPTTGSLQAIADQTSMLGGSMETMNTIILATGKAYSKGKIEAEEWNMMAEKGVRVSQLFADALGVTEAQVVELRSQGKLGREEIEKFLQTMGGATAGASLEFMDTFVGKWSVLKDNISLALNELASNGALDVLTEAMGELIEKITWAIESGALQKFGEAFANGLRVALSFVGRLAEGLLGLLRTTAELGTTFGDLRIGLQMAEVDAFEAKLGRLLERQRELNEKFGDSTYWTKEMHAEYRQLGNEIREMQDVLARAKKRLDAIEKTTSGFAAAEAALNDVIRLVNEGIKEQTKPSVLPKLADDTNAAADATESLVKQSEKIAGYGGSIGRMSVYLIDQARYARAVADEYYNLSDAMSEAAAAGFHNPEIFQQPLDKFAEDWTRTLEDMRTEVFSRLGDVFVDLFTGETDGISDALGDMAETFAGMFGNHLAVALGQTMRGEGEGLWSGPGSGGTFQENMQGMGSGWNALAGLGGSALMSYGQRSGGTGGILAGAIGGALQAGAMSGWNPYAIVAGAIAGAAMSYFGGGEKLDPHVFLNYNGSRGGFGVDYQVGGDIEWSPAGRREWLRNLNTVFRESFGAYRDTLQTLALATGDVGLMRGSFDVENFDFGRLEGTPEEIARYISNEWLPAALDEAFGAAFREGLGQLGVGDDTLAALFSELADLGMKERLEGLNTFIRAIASAYDLMDEMDWGTMMQRIGEDSLTTLMRGLGDIMEQVQVFGAGWDDLSLLEQAEELDQINQLVAQAREAEIQMLRQIDSLQKSINRSIDQQIEGIRTGGMTDAQRQSYYMEQIQSIMSGLRAGAYASPEALQLAMGDLQSYISNYASAMGDDLYTAITPSGYTAADMLVNMLEEARGLSDTALDGMRDQIEAANQALIDELARLTDAIINYGETWAPGPTGPAPPGKPGTEIDLRLSVEPTSMFEVYVTNIVQREINSASYPGPY